MTSLSKPIDVLIIGSGPVGLTCAVEAKRFGLSARIIERKAQRSTHDSRALVVHSRVMELLEPMGSITDKILDKSIHGGKLRICFSKDDFVGASFEEGNWGDTKYPHPCFLPQYETEKILEEEFNAGGGSVEYGTSLEALEQDEESGLVTSTIRKADGTEEVVESKYVIGCDGGRSKTRELLGIGLHRIQSDVYFIVADVKFTVNPFHDDDGPRVFPHRTGACAFLPLPEESTYRLVIQTPEGITNESDVDLNKEFFEQILHERTDGLDFVVELKEWQTIFKITHGVADSFSKGHVFLAGDASHVHSPVGGQGMNYGMQDAINLMWKLAWAERAAARDPSSIESTEFILKSYNDERHTMGEALIKGVGFLTQAVTTRYWILQKIRNFVIRIVFPLRFKDGVRSVSQLDLVYDPSSSEIIVENDGTEEFICKPGERLPNLGLDDGSLLYSKIDRVHHTWVYLNQSVPDTTMGGATAISAIPMDEKDQVSVPVIPESNLKKPQVVLVRPDLWVAGIDETAEKVWNDLSEYCDENSLETM